MAAVEGALASEAESSRRSSQEPRAVVGLLRWTSPRLALTLLALFAATSMQGCLPPDWSFCDCDFRDNMWNTVINDVHMLWNVSDEREFMRLAMDNSTWTGRYLQNPPADIDCPTTATVFWKAWPQYGMTRGLIEGSMGDLWMPGARDRIKSMCMSGHLGLLAICSQHFLVKAARAIEAGDPGHMRHLESAYSHMVGIRNLGQAYQLRNCMGQMGWSLDVGAFHGYTVKWLGPESQGTQPVAAYKGGQIDPWQMLYSKPMAHTDKSRKDSFPERRTCAPYKDPTCWKRQSKLLVETCEYCCSPFEHKTGNGSAWCWDDVYTYERCCQQDFKDLICSQNRKGEEGGCVDCKKTVSWECLTPPEKSLKDAEAKYNVKVDLFNTLQETATKLNQDIAETQTDLSEKDNIYRHKHQAHNERIQIWHVAFHNETRLLSVTRLQQQTSTWNTTSQVLSDARAVLQVAKASLQNATATLQESRRQEDFGKQTLGRNESEYRKAIEAHAHATKRLEAAEEAQAKAEAADASARAEAEAAAEVQQQAALRSLAANRSRAERYEATAEPLDAAEAARDATRDVAAKAQREDRRAAEAAALARASDVAAREALSAANAAAEAAERSLASSQNTVSAAVKAREDAEAQHSQALAELEVAREKEARSQEALTNRTGSSAPVLCLVSRTPANASAQPKVPPVWKADSDEDATCGPTRTRKDKNEFCNTWAQEGNCEKAQKYMIQNCASSCASRGVVAPALPACPALSSATSLQPPSAPTDNVNRELLAKLIADLLQVAPVALGEAASAEAELQKVSPNDIAHERGVVVPEEFKVAVTSAGGMLAAARQRQASATSLQSAREGALQTAEDQRDKASKQEDSARENLAQAVAVEVAAQGNMTAWQALVAANETATEHAHQVVKDRRDDLRLLQGTADKALSLEQGLAKARQLADEGASRSREAVKKSKHSIAELEEHVATLNSSLSENLTTLVSDWLQQQEENEKERLSSTWSSRFLAAAKSVLVNMVGSVESFLDAYVVNLADKDAVMELVKAVEDRKAAFLQLLLNERAAMDADAQAQSAKVSLTKAEASRRTADEAAAAAALLVPPAVELAEVAEVLLNQTRIDLATAVAKLEDAKAQVAKRKAELSDASAALAAAKLVVVEKAAELRSAREAVGLAKAEVSQAMAGLSAAEIKLSDAQAELVGGSLALAQQHCRADETDFEVYLQYKDLISLAKYVVVQRLRVGSVAATRLERRVSALREAQVSDEAAKDGLADSRRVQEERKVAAAATDADLIAREAEGDLTASVFAEKDAAFLTDQVRVDALLDQRAEVDKAASNASNVLIAEAHAASAALNRSLARTQELEAAVNSTQQRTNELELAKAAEADGLRELERCQVWLADFNASLLLDRKEQILKLAKEEEARRNDFEVRSAKREARMKTLMSTHEGHLKLCDTQVELPEKEAARQFAQTEHEVSEKNVVDTQTKLDNFVKSEAETQTNIHKTYKEIGELLEVHKLAQIAHDEQDPKDRERSFSTQIER